MAADMKSVKLRIKSVQSTMQITKAMELVASSKLRRAKERADTCRPYFRELYQSLQDIARENTDFSSVYAKEAEDNSKACYVVIAGDRGLAGGYNANVLKCLENDAAGKDYVVLPIGKKAVEYFQRKGTPCLSENFAEIADISVADCFEIAGLLCEGFRKKEFGHIDLCYTVFQSMLTQTPEVFSVLPMTDIRDESGGKVSTKNLIWYEPDAETVFDAIVPEYMAGLIYGAVCESVASELAARRMAMEAATSNAEEMIEKLNLYYNRARQAGITQEITEIVAGAEE